MRQAKRFRSIALFVGGCILTAQCQAGWSFTVVHPSGATTSAASGIRNGRAVGNVDGQTATWIVNVPGWTTMGPGVLERTDGVQQVGYIPGAGGVWSGTPGSFIDLFPTQIPTCVGAWVKGVFAGEQAGAAVLNNQFTVAGIWQDSPSSFTSLAPAGSVVSFAEDTHAGQQTGWLLMNGQPGYRAVVWYGTPSSVVSLHPPFAFQSFSLGCYMGKQVGAYVLLNQNPILNRAALWSGTSASMIDLHPPSAQESVALATYGQRQAGYTTNDGLRRAAVWNSTAQSYYNLHSLMANNYEASEALGIWTDNAGLYTYVAGYAVPIGQNNRHAVIWKLTPDQNITLTVNLLDTVAIFAGPRVINYEIVKAGNTIASGSSQVFQSGFSLTVPIPITQLGAATITLDGSSFLRRKVAFTLTGSNQGLGTILVKNGDADLSGEVDAADIDLVVAEFGSQAIGNTDVDVSGEWTPPTSILLSPTLAKWTNSPTPWTAVTRHRFDSADLSARIQHPPRGQR